MPSNNRRHAVAEVAGATAAECVAVCCCFPCGLANFLLLAFYKLPAGLCRRMLRSRRRRKMLKRGLLQLPPAATVCTCGACEHQRVHPMCAKDALDVKRLYAAEADNDNDNDNDRAEVMALEKEMWDQFFSTGFWRSSSNRERESSQLSAP